MSAPQTIHDLESAFRGCLGLAETWFRRGRRNMLDAAAGSTAAETSKLEYGALIYLNCCRELLAAAMTTATFGSNVFFTSSMDLTVNLEGMRLLVLHAATCSGNRPSASSSPADGQSSLPESSPPADHATHTPASTAAPTPSGDGKARLPGVSEWEIPAHLRAPESSRKAYAEFASHGGTPPARTLPLPPLPQEEAPVASPAACAPGPSEASQ